jgi:hypothetical protein
MVKTSITKTIRMLIPSIIQRIKVSANPKRKVKDKIFVEIKSSIMSYYQPEAELVYHV